MMHKERSLFVFLMAVMSLPAQGNYPAPRDPKVVEIDQLVLAGKTSGAYLDLVDDLKRFIEDDQLGVYTRIHAVIQLGDLRLQGTETYLFQLASELARNPTADSGLLRAHAYLASTKVKILNESDPQEQIDLLKRALRARFEGKIPVMAILWAAEELCDKGCTECLGVARDEIRKLTGSAREEKKVRLCELKAQAVAEHPRRIDALTAALKKEDPLEDPPDFHLWAIRELGKLATEEAETALVEHAERVKELSDVGPAQEYRAVLNELEELGWDEQKMKDFGILRTYQ